MLGRHIRTAGLRRISEALTKHALALAAPPPLDLSEQQPATNSPSAAAAVPKVVATPPAT